jgi:glycosyltransferase involved in cell wall biosynthesis
MNFLIILKQKLNKIFRKKINTADTNAVRFKRTLEKFGPYRALLRKPSLAQPVSLVIACYNIENYIDECLWSLTTQSVGTAKLEIICVDDGSTDNTSDKIVAWTQRYPGTIKHLRHRENRGVSAARNTGLEGATGDWISFPDGDDFTDRNYLHHVNSYLRRETAKTTEAIICRMWYYSDVLGTFSKRVPLSRRFKKRETTRRIDEMDDFIVMQTANAFFRASTIKHENIRFNEETRPYFEDAEFANRFLMQNLNGSVAYLRKALYFARRKEGLTKHQADARRQTAYFVQQPKAWNSLAETAKQLHGNVPRFIQNVLLHQLGPRLFASIYRSNSFWMLSAEEMTRYKQLIAATLNQIDKDTIELFSSRAMSHAMRVAAITLKNASPISTQRVFAYNSDPFKKTVSLMYVSHTGADTAEILINGRIIKERLFEKIITHKFFEKPLIFEHRFSVPFPDGELEARIDGKLAEIRFQKWRRKLDKLQFSFLRKAPKQTLGFPLTAANLRRVVNSHSSAIKRRYEDCWIVMDRPTKADDNAEHLYRYLLRNRPDINAYFVIGKSSPDWQRLHDDGFRLIDFLTDEHYFALANARFLISSHGSNFVRQPFRMVGAGNNFRYRFIFLQHGVNLHNQSRLFNGLMPRLLITATPGEYESIVEKYSDYKQTENDTLLSGIPRHDNLLNGNISTDTIFILPTWRENLVLPADINGVRPLRPDFAESECVTRWRSLLNSKRLKGISEKYNKPIVFCPHPNFVEGLSAFQLPSYIKSVNMFAVPSIQPLFREAAVMVSDYTSVMFEAAFLNKPVVYYQFDRETFFDRHTFQPGYFDYDRDGFGPLCSTEEQALDSIERAVSGAEPPVYSKRRIDAFKYRDGLNSKRIVERIESLDHPL